MSIQDQIFFWGMLVFIIALVPALITEQKPPPGTCVLTGGILLVFGVNYASLDLWWSAAIASANGAAWLVLLWQQRPRRAVKLTAPTHCEARYPTQICEPVYPTFWSALGGNGNTVRCGRSGCGRSRQMFDGVS